MRGMGEHVGDEVALVDLEAALVLLQPLALLVDRRPGRHQPREALGGGVDELGHAQRPAPPVGQRVVDLLDVLAQALARARHVPPTRRGLALPRTARAARA